MQRKLIENNSISSEFILELHDMAEKQVSDLAKMQGNDYADDEIANELEPLLIPYLMEKDLANKTEFDKIQKMVHDWYPPDYFTSEQVKKCALAQQIMLGFFKNYPEMIEEKFQIISSISTHKGWEGIAVSKSGKEDKVPDLLVETRKKLEMTHPENFSFSDKEALVNSVVKEASKKYESSSSFFSFVKRDEVTLAYYKLLKDWHGFNIHERTMQIENILHALDEQAHKRNILKPGK